MANAKKETIKPDKSIGSLSRLGFKTLSDCLFTIPKEYRDYTNPIKDLNYASPDCKKAYLLRNVSYQLFDSNKTRTRKFNEAFRISMLFEDVNGKTIEITSFGIIWPWQPIVMATEKKPILLWGLLGEFNGSPQLQNVEIVNQTLLGKVAPVYSGKSGRVSAQKVHEGVYLASGLVEDAAMSLVARVGLRDTQLTQYAGMPARDIFHHLHWPTSVKQGQKACEMASKLSIIGLVHSATDYRAKIPSEKSSIKISGEHVANLISKLPFPLTNDQTRAIQMIVQGLREPFPLLDLISADVGVGKSITFMIPAAAASLQGQKIAIMAPTMLLAKQLYEEMKSYFPFLDIGLVEKSGKINNSISVGTTALIGASKRSKVRFGLVIVDEQHKFGAEQRSALIQDHTNLIESTATPIPRSIALVSYGGYRLIHMTECPVKKKIVTRVVTKENNIKAMEFVKETIRDKKIQMAVVYPAVEGGEGTDGKNVKDATVKWEKIFPGKVTAVHGKLEEEEKNRIISEMKDGVYDVMVASTLIEVGLTINKLHIMMVVNADHFGLAQLHQLRGRVARKGGVGYMLLIPSKDAEDDAIDRLRILEECSDGFELAERDMKNRGFGSISLDGEEQHGTTNMMFWGAAADPKEIEKTAENMTKILAELQ